MGREDERGTFVSIRKEGPTLSYLVPLFVVYRLRFVLYTVFASA